MSRYWHKADIPVSPIGQLSACICGLQMANPSKTMAANNKEKSGWLPDNQWVEPRR